MWPANFFFAALEVIKNFYFIPKFVSIYISFMFSCFRSVAIIFLPFKARANLNNLC